MSSHLFLDVRLDIITQVMSGVVSVALTTTTATQLERVDSSSGRRESEGVLEQDVGD